MIRNYGKYIMVAAFILMTIFLLFVVKQEEFGSATLEIVSAASLANNPNQASTTKMSAVVTYKTSPSTVISREKPNEVKNDSITEENIFDAINWKRYDAGLFIYKRNPTLDEVAKLKLESMIKDEYFAHNSPQGLPPWYWFEEAEYKYEYAGENLAIEFNSLIDVVDAWIDSPTHRANVLSGVFTETGIAVKGDLIVQVFAKSK